MRVKVSFSVEGLVFLFIFCPFIAVLIYLSIAALRKDDSEALDHYEMAQKLIAQKRLPEAERELFRGIFKANTIQPMFYRALGHIYFKSHRYLRAAVWYDVTIKADPRYEPSVMANLAISYSELGKETTALKLLKEFKRRYPRSVRREAAELLPILERRQKQGVAHSPTASNIQIALTVPKSAKRPFLFGGNWLPGGRPSDAYGYRYSLLKEISEGHFQSGIDLQPYPELPYQGVVKDSAGQVIAFGRFEVSQGKHSEEKIQLDWRSTPFSDVSRKIPGVVRRSSASIGKKNRIFIFWIDGGSWWFVRSGIERGLLPNSADILHNGAFAEMRSQPPFTAIAIKRLTTFETAPTSLFDLALLELKGLQFFDRFIPSAIGSNKTLSEALRKKSISFVDLTFNDAYVNDPEDISKNFGFKAKEEGEYEFDPTKFKLDEKSVVRKYIRPETLASLFSKENLYGKWLLSTQWDDAELKLGVALKLFENPDGPEVILFRLANSDVLQHYFFENQATPSKSILFLELFYQYLDECIGRIRATLGKNDTLLVISDHGILSHTLHHPSALFMADGPLFSGGQQYDAFPIQRFPYIVFELATKGKVSPDLHLRN